MIVIGVDFETTGLDPQKDRIIEVGAVEWETDKAFPISLESEFCYADDLPEIDPSAAAANGLSKTLLSQYGVKHIHALMMLNAKASRASAFVGHNCAQFDKPFYVAECERAHLKCEELPWIDTTCDIKYPPEITTRKLTHLAAEHGFLNPFPHRAVFDVLTMLRIFQQYDPINALAYAQQPLVTLQAIVSFDDKEKAKQRGYRWKAETRQWLKSMRLPDVELERAEAGFKILEVGA